MRTASCYETKKAFRNKKEDRGNQPTTRHAATPGRSQPTGHQVANGGEGGELDTKTPSSKTTTGETEDAQMNTKTDPPD